MLEADHQFRRINGRIHLPKSRPSLLVLQGTASGHWWHEDGIGAR
jgi:hypothetical protein